MHSKTKNARPPSLIAVVSSWISYVGPCVGGSDADEGYAIAVDGNGDAYVTGSTSGSRFPTSATAYRTSATSGGVALKINSAGNLLAYSTYLPATSPKAIAVDTQGRAIITGSASSAFTTTAGALQTAFGGSDGALGLGDAFVLQLNAAGSGLVFGTFFGGAGADEARGVTLDNQGRIAIAGTTTSTNLRMVTPYQAARAGDQDGSIAVMSADGASLVASTYFGGTDRDQVYGIAADPFGNVVVTGWTASADLPMVNAHLTFSSIAPTHMFSHKGFLAKFSASTMQPVFSTLTGDSENCCETNYAVGVDTAGDIHFVGDTTISNSTGLELVSTFMSRQYVSAMAGTSTSASVVYVSSISRDGQTFRYQSMVAPCNSVNLLFFMGSLW